MSDCISEGHLWMQHYYDRFPGAVRRRLAASPFNICPAKKFFYPTARSPTQRNQTLSYQHPCRRGRAALERAARRGLDVLMVWSARGQIRPSTMDHTAQIRGTSQPEIRPPRQLRAFNRTGETSKQEVENNETAYRWCRDQIKIPIPAAEPASETVETHRPPACRRRSSSSSTTRKRNFAPCGSTFLA